MRAVGQRDTAAEMRLRRAIWAGGMRYRTNLPTAGTTPDVVFTRCKVAVFVDGCFWHGCPQHYKEPVRNAEFWSNRLATNQTRDARDTLRLQSAGWRVLRFWECDIRYNLPHIVEEIRAAVA